MVGGRIYVALGPGGGRSENFAAPRTRFCRGGDSYSSGRRRGVVFTAERIRRARRLRWWGEQGCDIEALSTLMSVLTYI